MCLLVEIASYMNKPNQFWMNGKQIIRVNILVSEIRLDKGGNYDARFTFKMGSGYGSMYYCCIPTSRIAALNL